MKIREDTATHVYLFRAKYVLLRLYSPGPPLREWRMIEVPDATDLESLHKIIMAAFAGRRLWDVDQTHFFAFLPRQKEPYPHSKLGWAGGLPTRYVGPANLWTDEDLEENEVNASKALLRDLGLLKGEDLLWHYDWGDDNLVSLRVRSISRVDIGVGYPVCRGSNKFKGCDLSKITKRMQNVIAEKWK